MSGPKTADAPVALCPDRSGLSPHALCHWSSFPRGHTATWKLASQGSGVKVSVWLCDLRQVSDLSEHPFPPMGKEELGDVQDPFRFVILWMRLKKERRSGHQADKFLQGDAQSG